MNDSSVSDIQPSAALSARNAYLLFYERCNRLGDAVGRIKIPGGSFSTMVPASRNTASDVLTQTLGKRKEREDEIGPQIAFAPQQIKLHQVEGAAFKIPQPQYQHTQQQRSSPYQHHPSSSPRAKYFQPNQLGQVRGDPSIGTSNFFTQHNKNRPRLVHNMIGKPR